MKKIFFLALTTLFLSGCSLASVFKSGNIDQCAGDSQCSIGLENSRSSGTENTGPVTESELENELNRLEAEANSADSDDFNEAGLSNSELGL